MQIDLCYVSYEYGWTVGAQISFEEMTGRCLEGTLKEYLTEFRKCSAEDVTTNELCARLSRVCSFVTLSKLFYCLIKERSTESNLLERIQDGMFRVGSTPDTQDDPKARAYTLLAVMVAQEVFDSVADKKKAARTKTDSD